MVDLGVSPDELQTLFQITSNPRLQAYDSQHFDDIVGSIHSLVPFTDCVVVHHWGRQSHTSAAVYSFARIKSDTQSATALQKRSGETGCGEQSFQATDLLRGFTTFGTYLNAFFWFLKQPLTVLDGGIGEVLRQVDLHEGVAGLISTGDGDYANTTLLLLQYDQQLFAVKHLVFVNLIVNCFHGYLEQQNTVFASHQGVRKGWTGESTWQVGRRLTAKGSDCPLLSARCNEYVKRARSVAATATADRQQKLTGKEREVLQWIVEGKTSWEVGRILSMSERTVKFHLRNIYAKLKVVNRAQAVTMAGRLGLI